MRKLLAVALVTTALIPAYAIGQDCRRHVEPAGDYSICPPEGWQTRSEKNRYHSFFGPVTNGFGPNINVYDETARMPLKEYVALGHKAAIRMAKKEGATRIAVISESNFTSDSNESAIRTLWSSEFTGVQIASLQYSFNGTRDRKVTVTCTMPEAAKSRFTPICDRSAKTYRTEKKRDK